MNSPTAYVQHTYNYTHVSGGGATVRQAYVFYTYMSREYTCTHALSSRKYTWINVHKHEHQLHDIQVRGGTECPAQVSGGCCCKHYKTFKQKTKNVTKLFNTIHIRPILTYNVAGSSMEQSSRSVSWRRDQLQRDLFRPYHLFNCCYVTC
jgi:hypothetical protein